MKIEIRDFNGLLSSSIAYINNSKDGLLQPLPQEEILRRARTAIGFIGYDLIFYNCEHYAHWCRLVNHLPITIPTYFLGMAWLSVIK